MSVEGFGGILEYGDGATAQASTTWTVAGEIVDLEPPEIDCADIKTTHMQSTNHAHTFQAGLITAGEAKIKIHFTAAIYTTLKGFLRTNKGYRVTYSDQVTTAGSRLSWDGYLKKISTKVDMEGLVTIECAFKVSGLPSFVSAT